MSSPEPRRTPTRRRSTAAAATLAAVLVVTACNDDGRTLAPARPDQTASVSTSSTTTLPATGVPGDSTIATPASTAPTGAPGPLEVTSELIDAGTIATRFTCDGDNVAPAMNWLPGPAGTAEIAVSLVDEDNPEFVHWVMAGLDPLSTGLATGQVPEFALTAVNSMGQTGYFGPCPPLGATHTYRLTVHFLIEPTELGDGADGADLLAVVRATAFAEASVSGTYARP